MGASPRTQSGAGGGGGSCRRWGEAANSAQSLVPRARGAETPAGRTSGAAPGQAEPPPPGAGLCAARGAAGPARSGAWGERGASGGALPALRRESQHVLHPAFHSSHRQAAPGLEERGAERAGGEMVREGGEEPGEEAEEDGPARRAGEGDHHAEHQHQVHHHPQVGGRGHAKQGVPPPGDPCGRGTGPLGGPSVAGLSPGTRHMLRHSRAEGVVFALQPHCTSVRC